MKQELPPLTALQILADIIKRAPMTSAEQIGAQTAIERLEQLNTEFVANNQNRAAQDAPAPAAPAA